MRVLVVDQDSALLTAITQLLGDYFTIDAVTTKADCLDLVRVNDFEVIVAGERLEDGSGLELLGQMGRDRPDMLRIFAVDRERLKLLKGRLGPFRLFRTLAYPIEPRQLLAALSAAAGIEEEIEPIEETVEPAPAPALPSPVEVTVRSVRQPAAPVPTRVPTATQAMVEAPAPQARREVHDFTLVDEEPAPPPQPKIRKGTRSRSGPRTGPPGEGSRGARQPTPEALAVGARLAAASRAKARQTNGPAFPPPLLEPTARRSAFLVGAGVLVVIGVMAVGFRISNSNDTPTFSTASLSTQPNRDPPEVIKLVADTELALQQDDYKAARTDIAALQQIAPTHPRLPFFEALLAKHEAESATPPSSGPSRWFSRHTSPPVKVNDLPARLAASTSSSRTPSPASPIRARPGTPAPRATEAPSIFTGKTVEDSNKPASLMKEPELIKRVAPEYPADAARKGIEGAVDLAFTVSPKGDVSDVTVVHCEPSSIFNRAAITAVRRWKYQPRTVNGVAVEAPVQLRMTFKLDGR